LPGLSGGNSEITTKGAGEGEAADGDEDWEAVDADEGTVVQPTVSANNNTTAPALTREDLIAHPSCRPLPNTTSQPPPMRAMS
jgi:hypothetical protein